MQSQKQAGRYIIAIDLGTSSAKAALVTIYGEVVNHSAVPLPLLLLEGGGAEQDPDQWWQAISSAIRAVMADSAVDPSHLAALVCTSQWSCTVAVDREGKPLMNAVSWLDTRGAPHIKRILKGALPIKGIALKKLLLWVNRTGGAPSQTGRDPIAHIHYIKAERPDIYGQTYKFLEAKDYLNLRLTGKYAASYDSITLHWVTDNRDMSRIRYDKRLLKMAQLDREKLPDLMAATDVMGTLREEVAKELGLPSTLPVVMGTPDIQSAGIGSGAVRLDEMHVYIGTSGWVSTFIPYKKVDVMNNIASLPSPIPDRYYLASEQESAGNCLQFLRDHLLYPKDELSDSEPPDDFFERLEKSAERVAPGSGGVIFTPWLNGERSPIDDHLTRGGFYNLSLRSTRSHLVRAVLEGVAYNCRWLYQAAEGFIGKETKACNFIGGGAKSDLWCQILADVMGRDIRQVKDPVQANVRGVAFLAAVALGHMQFDDISDKIQISHTYHPDPKNQRLYAEMFNHFKSLYKANRRIYARLNRKRDGT